MRTHLLLASLLLLPLVAGAQGNRASARPVEVRQEAQAVWEEDRVLEFILVHSPILQSYREVTATYTPPASFGEQLKQNTQWYAQLGAGGTEYQPGTLTAFTGVRVTIPLASLKEQREFAEKRLKETEKMDEVRGQVLTDIAQLRQYEANLAAVETQREFYSTKSKWLQDRVNQGLEEAEVLWANSQQLNAVAAEVIKLKLLIEAQRKKIAQYAGDQWKVLLAYLSGKGRLPGG